MARRKRRKAEDEDAAEEHDEEALACPTCGAAVSALLEPLPVGRPTLLDATTHALIVSHVRAGASITDAASRAGIARRTLQGWLHRGRVGDDGDEAFVELVDAVDQAKALAKSDRLARIANGTMINGAPDWKAEAWILERQHPEEFSKTTTQRTVVVAEIHEKFSAMRGHMTSAAYSEMILAFAKVEGVDVDGPA